MSSKKKDNPLANQLANLDLDLPDGDDNRADRQKKSGSQQAASPQQGTGNGQSKKAPPKSKKKPPTSVDDGADDRPPASLSDDELFSQAVDNIDASRIYDAKFRGEAGADLPPGADEHTDPPVDGGSSPSPSATDDRSKASPKNSSVKDEAAARQAVGQVRDSAYFARHVGGVEPLENRDKYHHSRRKRSRTTTDNTDSQDAADKLTTPLLPRQGNGLHQVPSLNKAQRRLLKNYAKARERHDTEEIHLRGESREEALVSLARFVEFQYRQNTPFIRIIHGRGIRSQGDPVLKPSVLSWLEGPGLKFITGYVPERTKSGDYGSLVVALVH